MPIYRYLDQAFFSKWNLNMAYVLGFFAADGTMIQNNRGAHFIEFHSTDRHIIKDIRKLMKSGHKISARDRGRNWKIGYRLQMGSKIIFSNLERLGFTSNKSLTMKLPTIPTPYISSFVRGYFDGDGCIYFRKHKVKNRKNRKWIFSTRFTSGSLPFLRRLHDLLKKRGLNGGFILEKNRGYELVFSHRDSLALYHLMYDNEPRIYLRRKYRLFNKAVSTLYGKNKQR